MSTQIKRLKQNEQEFVPITLAEAVVVKTDKLPLLSGTSIPVITTLDRVLFNILGLTRSTLDELNALIENKQDKITWGDEFTFDNDGTVHVTSTMKLYEIVANLAEATDPDNNKIYLVPNEQSGFTEYIYVNNQWELIGTIQTDGNIDLDDYVKVTQFNAFRAESITAEDVTTSTGVSVYVSYDVDWNNNNPYDSVIVSDSSDYIG